MVSLRALWGVATLASWCCACAPAAPGADTRPVLRIALASAPVSLDPHLQDERNTLSILAHVYEALTAFDADMRLRPDLAESWDNPTDTTWHFRLRRDTRFHDDQPLTADDVVASLERARQHPESQVAGFLVSIANIRKLDEYTVAIETSGPSPLLAARLSFVAILPAGAPARIENPIGSGPWVFEDLSAERLRLRAFDSHRRGPATWSAVEISFIESEKARTATIREGTTDLAAMIPAGSEAGLRDAGISVLSREGLAVTFLGMRLGAPPFSDLSVRHALDLAIDRADLITTVLGTRARAAYQATSPAVFGHAAGLKPRPHDPSAARERLETVSVGAPLHLAHPPGLELEALAIAADLTAAGLETVAETITWPDLYRQLSAGTVDLFLAGYGCDSGSASDIFDAALHTRDTTRGYGGTNFMEYSNPVFDELVERANATLDERTRRALLEAASRIVAQDLPIIPLWIAESTYAIRPGLRWRPRLDRRVLAHEVTVARDN